MTVNDSDFYDWQKATKLDSVKFRTASPNLVALKDYLVDRWHGQNVGLYQKRPIKGGTAPSSHSFGAALDWNYGAMDRQKIESVVLPMLIANSAQLGIQAIHDYAGCRIWRATRAHDKNGGWKKQEPDKDGMGQGWSKWLHIETTKTMWKNKTPILHRI